MSDFKKWWANYTVDFDESFSAETRSAAEAAFEAGGGNSAGLIWKPEEDGVRPEDQIGYSGEITVGAVSLSGSGRWRWELVMLPGLTGVRDDRRGWEETEDAAKERVQGMWADWVRRAGL